MTTLKLCAETQSVTAGGVTFDACSTWVDAQIIGFGAGGETGADYVQALSWGLGLVLMAWAVGFCVKTICRFLELMG